MGRAHAIQLWGFKSEAGHLPDAYAICLAGEWSPIAVR